MATIMITGAGGFLGSHILQAVLEGTDWNVVAVDSFRHNGGTDRILNAMTTADFPHQIGDSRNQIIDDTRRRVRLFTHDLEAPISSKQIAEIGRCEYVVHAAARSSVDDSIEDPYRHVKNNIDATLNMLAYAADAGPERYLHISTDEVFGPYRLRDEEQHSPSSPYAASKACCEDLTKAWRRTYGIAAGIVNSANLFGERQSQLAFIPQVIRKIRDKEQITIHTQGTGGDAAWRAYTYAPNLARWCVDYMVKPDPVSRTLLPGQMGINVLKLAQSIADIMEADLDYVVQDGQWTRPGFDGSYAQLPGEPWGDIPASEGLENTVRWFLANPTWLL